MSCEIDSIGAKAVYVIAADWPWNSLTRIGKCSKCIKRVRYTHLGLMFNDVTDCTRRYMEDANSLQTGERIPLKTNCITWDYLISKEVQFQDNNGKYYNDRATKVLRKLNFTRPQIKSLICAALDITYARPQNLNIFRYDAILPCLPFRSYVCCWFCVGESSKNSELLPLLLCRPSSRALQVGPSTCVALVLRAIATALDPDNAEEIASDDGAAFKALRMERRCCGPWFLTQFTPSQALRALEKFLGREETEWCPPLTLIV